MYLDVSRAKFGSLLIRGEAGLPRARYYIDDQNNLQGPYCQPLLRSLQKME